LTGEEAEKVVKAYQTIQELIGRNRGENRSALALRWVVRFSEVQAQWWRLICRWRVSNRWRRWRIISRGRLRWLIGWRRLITLRRCLVDQYGFAVLDVLFGQRKPRVRHAEQGVLAFMVIDCLSERQTFLGIEPIPL
jgi:hypothetical protein